MAPTLSHLLSFYLFTLLFLGVCASETVNDAAKIARRLVDLSPSSIGTMATIYPPDHPTLPNEPFALQEYYASCHENGSLILLFMPISRHSQNMLASPGCTASITVADARPAANRARVSLMGNVTIFYNLEDTPNRAAIETCYVKKHPDARLWLPGKFHSAYWARFDPHSIYFVGGFGGAHYIGDIPLDVYQSSGPSNFMGTAGRVIIQAMGGDVLL